MAFESGTKHSARSVFALGSHEYVKEEIEDKGPTGLEEDSWGLHSGGTTITEERSSVFYEETGDSGADAVSPPRSKEASVGGGGSAGANCSASSAALRALRTMGSVPTLGTAKRGDSNQCTLCLVGSKWTRAIAPFCCMLPKKLSKVVCSVFFRGYPVIRGLKPAAKVARLGLFQWL